MSLGHGSGLFTHTEDNLSTSGTDILCLVGGRVAGASHTQSIFATATGHICNLRVKLNTAPGIGKSRTFTLYKNGASTALTCTISGTETEGSDLTHSISLSSNNYYEWRCTSTANPAASKVRISARFNPFAAANDYAFNLSGLVGSTQLSQTTTEYISLAGDCQAADTVDTGARCYLMGSGDIIAFATNLITSPVRTPPPSASRRFQLFKNTTDLGTGYRVNYVDNSSGITTATPGTPTAYADGDYLTVKSTITAGTPRASYFSCAALLAPDGQDEHVVCYTSMVGNLPTGSVTHYGHIAKGQALLSATLSERRSLGMAWRGKKFLTNISQLPGGKGQSWSMVSPYGFQITYGPASALTQTDTTGGLIKNVFENIQHSVQATSIDAAIKSKHNFSVLLEPTPQMRGGMEGHF